MKTAEVGLYGSVPRRAPRITRVTGIGYSSPVPRLELGSPFLPDVGKRQLSRGGVDAASRFHQQRAGEPRLVDSPLRSYSEFSRACKER